MNSVIYNAETGQVTQQEFIFNEPPLQEAKQRVIGLVKSNAAIVIYRRCPGYKQNNASLGIYTEEQVKPIKNWIKAVRQATEDIEAEIGLKNTLQELNLIDVTEQAIEQRATVIFDTL